MRALIPATMLLLLVPAVTLAAEDPEQAEQHCMQGDNDPSAWIDACQAAINARRISDPHRLADLYGLLGFADINLALAKHGNFDQALADLNKGLALDPSDLVALNNRANAYMYRGDYQLSLNDTDEVIRRMPDEGKPHGLRCVVLRKMGRAAEGVTECQRAITLGSTEFWSYEQLGEAYEAVGDLGNATTAYRRSLELQPDYADARDGLERVLHPPV